MHLSSIEKMTYFRDHYLSGMEEKDLKIFDLGSRSLGGNYRTIFDVPGWEYRGVDLSDGENVDHVLSDPYTWLEIETASIDVLISGQTFEHIEFFWQTILEIARVMKPGALCCLIAPSNGPEHRYPVDCWRFYPDGFKALARYAGLSVLETTTDWHPSPYPDGSEMWADTILVAQKPMAEKETEGLTEDHVYDGVVIKEGENALSKVVHYISPDSDILELGPATGYLTRYLKEELNCTVDCIEKSPVMAAEAEKYCRKMLVADLEDLDSLRGFDSSTYDYVVIADVLEHLQHDKKVLAWCRNRLKPDGRCILSIPNIAHAVVIGSLLEGKFEYRDEGLLDKTHLRFYTRDSLAKLLRTCDLSLEAIETVDKLPEDTEFGDSLTGLPISLQQKILSKKDALVYQFVLVCSPGYDPSAEKKWNSSAAHQTAIDLRRLFLNSHNEQMELLRKQVADLQSGLAHAQRLAEDRQKEIVSRSEQLAHAQQLALERFEELKNYKREFEKAQALSYERYGQIQDLRKHYEAEITKLKGFWPYRLVRIFSRKSS